MPSDEAHKPLALTVEAIATPLGAMTLVADPHGTLYAADFADCEARWRTLLQRRIRTFDLRNDVVAEAPKAALARYFAGDGRALLDIAIALNGTPSQNAVWAAVRAIPAGATSSYSGLARDLGRPRSARAVGHANAANPFCVVVPCHRLVGASGDLTGYSGGLARKRWLLDHEAGRKT